MKSHLYGTGSESDRVDIITNASRFMPTRSLSLPVPYRLLADINHEVGYDARVNQCSEAVLAVSITSHFFHKPTIHRTTWHPKEFRITAFFPSSAPAGWVKSIWPKTRGWAAKSH